MKTENVTKMRNYLIAAIIGVGLIGLAGVFYPKIEQLLASPKTSASIPAAASNQAAPKQMVFKKSLIFKKSMTAFQDTSITANPSTTNKVPQPLSYSEYSRIYNSSTPQTTTAQTYSYNPPTTIRIPQPINIPVSNFRPYLPPAPHFDTVVAPLTFYRSPAMLSNPFTAPGSRFSPSYIPPSSSFSSPFYTPPGIGYNSPFYKPPSLSMPVTPPIYTAPITPHLYTPPIYTAPITPHFYNPPVYIPPMRIP